MMKKKVIIAVVVCSFAVQVLPASAAAKKPSVNSKAGKEIYKLNEYPSKPLQFNKTRPFPSGTKTTPEAQQDEKLGLTVGIKAGSSAGLTGAMGDVSYSLSDLLPGAALRGSVGYLTGGTKTDTGSLKLATVNLDALYSIGAVNDPKNPLSLYVGGGLIFPWKVNRERSSGAWGAHAYLGSKYSLQDSTAIYGELAYSGIKYQAEEKALRGVEAMLGYSYSF